MRNRWQDLNLAPRRCLAGLPRLLAQYLTSVLAFASSVPKASLNQSAPPCGPVAQPPCLAQRYLTRQQNTTPSHTRNTKRTTTQPPAAATAASTIIHQRTIPSIHPHPDSTIQTHQPVAWPRPGRSRLLQIGPVSRTQEKCNECECQDQRRTMLLGLQLESQLRGQVEEADYPHNRVREASI